MKKNRANFLDGFISCCLLMFLLYLIVSLLVVIHEGEAVRLREDVSECNSRGGYGSGIVFGIEYWDCCKFNYTYRSVCESMGFYL